MTEESAPPAHSNEPEWYLDDQTPGHGQRPEWMPQQFKKVSDIGKSYMELQKKFGSFTGAPEKYDLESLELDPDDHVLNVLSDVGKEMNMSQDGFNKLVGRLLTAKEIAEQQSIQEEVKKLGPDGERQLKEFNNWTKDYLTPAEQEVVKGWVTDAPSLQTFNRMMAHTHMSQVPTMNSMHIANNFESVQDLRRELTQNIKKFESDKAYNADWSARMARAVARNPER